ncbi:MAG TPA: EsaB/YukD family protein [Cellulomonas sp.]
MSSHVDVTLVHQGGRVDLRIPTRITVHRLIDELAAILPGLRAGMRRYQLRIPGKGLLLTEEDVLARHPVAAGDIVDVVVADPRG